MTTKNNRFDTALCPHCGTENLVRENGRYVCNGCEGLFDVDWFHVSAVRQPDGVSCGWATTKWLLQSFGVLDVTDKQLRAELNTDAERGIRAWMGVIREKGQIKIMDPARGRYVSFHQGISYWEYGDHKPEFLVFGFVRR